MEQTGTDCEEFASALKRRREGAGLSRDELASAVGVSSSTIKALELGARNPSKELSRKLRRVLDINPEAGSTDSSSVLNCWIAPGFSALGLLDSLIATVNGPGGSLEQSNLYLDPLSAAAWCQLVQGRDYHTRFGITFRESARAILQLTKGAGLDVVALGCGDGRREVSLVTELVSPGDLADLRLYLLDISQPLLSEAYTHAAQTLDRFRGVLVTAVQGNFHHLPRYGQLLYRPEASHRRRLVTMLGGTFGNLDNELQYISGALSGFSQGDLFLCDVTRSYTESRERSAIDRADPALREGRQILDDTTAVDFFTGPLRRYQRGPAARIEVHHELGPQCVIPGSYQIDQVAIVSRRGERDRRFVVGRSRRYAAELLGRAMSGIGWSLHHHSEIGQPGSAPMSLLLFERQ